MKKLAYTMLAVLILVSCCPLKPMDTGKVRIVTATIVSDKDKVEIDDFINDCNREIERQVGIRLSIVKHIPLPDLPSINNIPERLSILQKIKYDSDMLINFDTYSNQDILAKLVGLLIPCPIYDAYIDDEYRKIIVMKNMDKRTFMHELYHAFILSHVHSASGIMQGYTIKLLPFLPPLNYTIELSEEDRKEVIGNKWRKFGEKVGGKTWE